MLNSNSLSNLSISNYTNNYNTSNNNNNNGNHNPIPNNNINISTLPSNCIILISPYSKFKQDEYVNHLI